MTNRITLEQFAALDRDTMVETIRQRDPALVKGKTRAKKDELQKIYRESLLEELGTLSQTAHSILSAEAQVGDVGISKVSGGRVPEHVHGPGCGHHHEMPAIAGTEEMARVNPEMPIMPFQDGAVIQIPPDHQHQEPDYVLRETGLPGELDEKRKRLVDAFVKEFNKVMENPANSTARREAKDYIFRLKVAGVILNKSFAERLDERAKHVRDVRRIYKLTGVNPSAKSAEESA